MEAALLPGLVPALSQTWSGWGCQASSKLPPGDPLRTPHHSQWAWSLLLMGLPGWPFMALGGLCLQAPGVLLSLPLHPETGPLPSPHSPSLLQGCPFRGAESGHRVPAGLSHHSGVSVVLLAVPPNWGAGKALHLLGRGPAPAPSRQQSQWPRSGLTPHPPPPHLSCACLVDLTASSLAELFPNNVHVFLISRREMLLL